MQEELRNPFEGPNGPEEGNGPKGQRIKMDQTDFGTSAEKQELVDADKELGSQIDTAASELSKNISDVERDSKEAISKVEKSVSDKVKDVDHQLSESVKAIDAVTGVDSSALPERLKAFKDEFVTLQAEWTKTVQGIEDPENMTEQEVIATNALKYYGWDYSTPAFLSFLDRGAEAFFGSIATEEYEEYERHVNDLLQTIDEISSDMDEVQNDIDAIEAIESPTEEDLAELESLKGEMDELKVQSSSIENSLRRITDVDPLSGKYGVADQDGCRQYLADKSSSDEKEFREELATQLVGYGAKAGYYKDLEAGFRAEAETWKTVKEKIAKKLEAGGELSPKENAEKFASENFESKYGFTENILAVLTWNEGNDDALGFVEAADNGIWESYVRHFEDLSQAIDEKSGDMARVQNDIDAIEAIESPTEEDLAELESLRGEMDELKVQMSELNDELNRISSPDHVDGELRVKSQAGSFAYYSDNKEREFKNFQEELATQLVGYGAKAGYYKDLESEFRAEAETWKTVKEDIAKKLEAGEELSTKEKAEKFASENFESKYGFIANAFAVLTWNEGNDDNKGFVEAADNGIWESYVRHFEDLSQAIDEKSGEMDKIQNDIDAIEAIESPTEEDLAELESLSGELDELKVQMTELNDELNRISSPDHVDRELRVKSQAGSFAYYSDMEDASDKSYREATSEMIGFENLSTELKEMSNALEVRIKNSEEIIEDSENYEPEVVKAAKNFIAAVGSKVTVVSLGKFQNVVHEEEKAAQETTEAIRLAETFNSMANEIAEQSKTISFRNLEVYPLPDGEATEFTIENPEGFNFEILEVGVNGIKQTEGEEVIFNGDTIQMAPGILLGRGDELRVVVKVEGSITIKPVEPKFGEYDFPGESTCIVRNAILKSMDQSKESLVSSEKDLTKDSDGFSAKTQFYTTELESFEASKNEAMVEIASTEAEAEKSNIEREDLTSLIDTTEDSIEENETSVTEKQREVSDNFDLIHSNKTQIETNKETIKELEADPYPDTAEIDRLNDSIKNMESEIAEKEKENASLEPVIATILMAIDQLKEELSNYIENVDDLIEQISRLDDKVAALKDDMTHFENGAKVVKKYITHYNKMVKDTTDAIASLQVEIAEAEKGIEDYRMESDRLGCGEK